MDLIQNRKQLLQSKGELEESDLLSRFMSYDDVDDRLLRDVVVNFVLAGRDSTSAALTWFFWLVSRNKRAEEEILQEILSCHRSQSSSSSTITTEAAVYNYEEVKEMNYLHGALCESMRLYPPVPLDSKQVLEDDVWPDGMTVRKGSWVFINQYAMGRSEALWGKDWEDFRPERWLIEDVGGDSTKPKKWRFVPEDPYKYPVFLAGPRVCLGKDMAFIQMKSIAAVVLRRFRVVPAVPNEEPVYELDLAAKMKDGFHVRILERNI